MFIVFLLFSIGQNLLVEIVSCKWSYAEKHMASIEFDAKVLSLLNCYFIVQSMIMIFMAYHLNILPVTIYNRLLCY